MIKIQNSKWSAIINPVGAELLSLNARETAEEFIWQRDPSVWAGSAPVLFPMVGILADGIARFKGKEYDLPKHGLVRKEWFELVNQSDASACFRFRSSAETERVYPFAFTFEVEFQLETDGLTVSHRVLNNSKERMPFSVGAHPAIALDLERYGIEDYFIEFNRPETLDRYRINGDGLCELGQQKYMDGSIQINLSADLFDDDALVFSDIASDVISVCRTGSDWRVALHTSGAPDLGLWSKPGGQAYVCIEPWYGFNDFVGFKGAFTERKNVQTVEPSKQFEQQYRLLPQG